MSKPLNELKRYELKYWVDAQRMANLLNFLQEFMRLDPHMNGPRPYQVTSLYFDNHEYFAYYEKYNGEHRRRKYRVRFYGDNPQVLFFEVKHKCGSFVTKIRRRVEHAGPLPQLLQEVCAGRWDDQLPEFALYMHRLDLQPTVWTCYRRTALVGRNNPALRITFDEQLRGGASQGLECDPGTLLPVQFSNWRARSVMEIKFDRFFPFWLDTVMRELGLEHSAISKYGLVMNRHRFLAKEPAWTH